MSVVSDFEDLLQLFHEHQVRYLIIGGMAFIFHAKPRYTKDMDIWVENTPANVDRANAALRDFGAPGALQTDRDDDVFQLGFAPNRLDFFLRVVGFSFDDVWANRVSAPYGSVPAEWIGLVDLLRIKSRIDRPKHQEDARILREVRDRNQPK